MLKHFITSLLFAGLLAILMTPANAQERVYSGQVAGSSLYDLPPRTLIDCPTAGTLPRGCFHFKSRIYGNGGVLGSTAIGLSSRLMLGMSYGAEGLISDHTANANPSIEFIIKLRLVDETTIMPAIAVGYNSQGYGAYIDHMDRYTYKSKGFYGVVSRSFAVDNMIVGLHAGVNYSLENEFDNEDEPTFFFGSDIRFAYNIGFAAEYDMALNDDRSSIGYAKGRGYLNTSIKWMYSENLKIELIFKNLLQNRQWGTTTFGRELRFTYIEFF